MNKLKTNININEFAITNLNNNNIPVLFNLKSKAAITKPLSYIKSDTGKTRHYTPAAQEWYNSIYTYNNNYIKTLPVADKNLMNLLKSYFNLQLNQKSLKINKRIPMRVKRVSTKKVFVGRGDLKHTNDKVLITFFVLNTEGMFLALNYERVKAALYYPKKALQMFVNYDRKVKLTYNWPFSLKKLQTSGAYLNSKAKIKFNWPFSVNILESSGVYHDGKVKLTFNRPFSLKELEYTGAYHVLYNIYMMSVVNKFANSSELELLNTYYDNLTSLVETNLLTVEEKHLMFSQKVAKWKPLGYLNFDEFKAKTFEEHRKEFIAYYIRLNFNKIKFTNHFMSKLIILVKKLYNKDVEFNIVNLKKTHLNSDIFTQAVSLKLRNRDNKLYRVLKSSLRKIQLPVIRKISERLNKPNKDEFFVNRIRNSTINSMFADNNTGDSLNNLLLSFYPAADNLEINIIKRSYTKKQKISLNGFVFRHHLKHFNLRGIRVEAKGRLTRRATASRSVFKMKWKGGLKNVDSSFRGLSTIMLRGYLKSNVQYSVLNSKNRNGAFGVKGWVSSK